MNASRPTLIDLLYGWLPAQRWYPAKGRQVKLRQIGTVRLQDPAGEVGLEVQLIAVDSGERVDVINVPLSYRTAPLQAAAPEALLGNSEHPDLGTQWIYDGAHDPVFVTAWLELMRLRGTTEDGRASGHASDEYAGYHPPSETSRTTVLGGEQSNTSVIVHNPQQPAIVKFFRVVSAGVNPDVEVGAGLTQTGCEEVPATYGWVTGRWPDAAAGTSATAHGTTGSALGNTDAPAGSSVPELIQGELSVLREFIPGSQDAWRQACAAALDGIDYTEQAAGLGRATAQVHLSLRKAFGSRTADAGERKQFLTGITGRIEWAWREAADAVGPYEQQLRDRLQALDSLEELPALQRIHGDYHLGQVLHSATRGWVILDFEGEPLRTAAERSLADVPLRDVVGMVRSFDYVAGVVLAHAGGAPEGGDDGAARAESARKWSQDCIRAFVHGYEQELGEPLDTASPLFIALWLDKALYEVVYELRNRPDWLHVPVAGVRKVLSGDNPVTGPEDAVPRNTSGKKEVD